MWLSNQNRQGLRKQSTPYILVVPSLEHATIVSWTANGMSALVKLTQASNKKYTTYIYMDVHVLQTLCRRV